MSSQPLSAAAATAVAAVSGVSGITLTGYETPEFIQQYLISITEAIIGEDHVDQTILTDMIRSTPEWAQACMFNRVSDRAGHGRERPTHSEMRKLCVFYCRQTAHARIRAELHTPEFIEQYLIALEESRYENPDEQCRMTDMIRGFPRWLQADMFYYQLLRSTMTDEEYDEDCASDAETESEPEEEDAR